MMSQSLASGMNTTPNVRRCPVANGSAEAAQLLQQALIGRSKR
jgi:hypothetical protein